MENLNDLSLGIELGSTRIKAVLVRDNGETVAVGAHSWENRLTDGVWTYTLDDVRRGLEDCYLSLKRDYFAKTGKKLTTLKALGISAMMHGYMAFDEAGELLVPFRTWRNTMTQEAQSVLTKALDFPIPQRWSAAHLYQAALNREEHLARLHHVNTLAGYVHELLSGERALGIGDASGMFPIDSTKKTYDEAKLQTYDGMLRKLGVELDMGVLLPTVKVAGEVAGRLTEAGARILDPEGDLLHGVPMAPPEGDAGTGMVATNSIKPKTANVSAGTSLFAMVVLERALKKSREEIDMVTTPVGDAVAMVHCNNCTTDLNAWADIFVSYSELFGVPVTRGDVLNRMFALSKEGDPDCGGLVSVNYVSGEHLAGVSEGRPMFVRSPEDKFDLKNFMKSNVYSCLVTLKDGMDILLREEKVALDSVVGHGGFFKSPEGAEALAAALDTPVTVMETAGEGGAWGMAVLAAYVGKDITLGEYLDGEIFANIKAYVKTADKESVKGFDAYAEKHKKVLCVERLATEVM